MTIFWNDNTAQELVRHGDTSFVVRAAGYYQVGETSTSAENTGNGFIVKFFSSSTTQQDYYVCLDYSQAHDLVIALSAFKKELGFV